MILSLSSLPPSVNASRQIMARGSRRFIGSTAKYRDWKVEAAKEVLAQRKRECLTEYMRVEITATLPKGRAPDLDNIIKPTLDALQEGGAISNDKLVRKIEAVWIEDGPPGMAICITPVRIGDAA